jgi:limonene-1,2-epoxide hydrolase
MRMTAEWRAVVPFMDFLNHDNHERSVTRQISARQQRTIRTGFSKIAGREYKPVSAGW